MRGKSVKTEQQEENQSLWTGLANSARSIKKVILTWNKEPTRESIDKAFEEIKDDIKKLTKRDFPNRTKRK